MSGFGCWVNDCTYNDEKACAKDGVNMYLVEGFPNTLVCESCYRIATGGDLPMYPYYDWATDKDTDRDSSGLIWGLGWISTIGADELAGKIRGNKA